MTVVYTSIAATDPDSGIGGRISYSIQVSLCSVLDYPKYREYVYSAVVYQKYRTRLRELIIFKPWRENISFLSTEFDIFDIRQHYVRNSIYLSTSDLLSFVISNTDKHEFSRIWKWITCCNDVMNDVDCVIKRDVYPQNVHSCSKNISGISVFVLKISVVYQK